MAFWKDKSGLKGQASEPTIVEQQLDQMNRLHVEQDQMTPEGCRQASGAIHEVYQELWDVQGVEPVYNVRKKGKDSWKVSHE